MPEENPRPGGSSERNRDQADTMIGTSLSDRYEIIAVLGKGGMGVVYKGRHKLVDRFVAIKVLKEGLLENDVTRKRFQLEAKAAGGLSHPNLISVFDYGFGPEGEPYLVMDFLEGQSLSDAVEKDGVLSLDRFAKIFSQTCKALNYIHKRNLVHRDLKPSNIMLVSSDDDPDFVKVVDFGIAKVMSNQDGTIQTLTETGQAFGSPPYMSPEQCMGKEIDSRADIYSLGCVMFEMLTGTPPIVGENPLQVLFKHVNDKPMPFAEANKDVNVPVDLQMVIMKTLEKDPSKRFQSAQELGEVLARVTKPGQSSTVNGGISTSGGVSGGESSSSGISGGTSGGGAGGAIQYSGRMPPPLPGRKSVPTPPPLPAAKLPVKQDSDSTTSPVQAETVHQKGTAEKDGSEQDSTKKKSSDREVLIVDDDEGVKKRRRAVAILGLVILVVVGGGMFFGPPLFENIGKRFLEDAYINESSRADELYNAEQYSEALPMFRNLVSQARKLYNDDRLADRLYRLAICMHRTGNGSLDDVMNNLDEARRVIENLHGSSPASIPVYTDILFEQGKVYEEKEDPRNAQKMYQEIIHLKAKQPQDSPKVVLAKWRLGETYYTLNELFSAETNLESAFDAYKSQQVKEPKAIASCGLLLARVQAKRGKLEQARQTITDVDVYLGVTQSPAIDQQIDDARKDIESMRQIAQNSNKVNSLSGLLSNTSFNKFSSTPNSLSSFKTSLSTFPSSFSKSSSTIASAPFSSGSQAKALIDESMAARQAAPVSPAASIPSLLHATKSGDLPPNLGLGLSVGIGANGKVQIREITRGGPAAKAGLLVNDDIVRIDGIPVDEPFDVIDQTRRRGIGAAVVLNITRDGIARTHVVHLKQF